MRNLKPHNIFGEGRFRYERALPHGRCRAHPVSPSGMRLDGSTGATRLSGQYDSPTTFRTNVFKDYARPDTRLMEK